MRRLGLHTPVRSADGELVDAFFVAAVSSILLIRIYLEAAGYPRLGGGGLHIAHVLWGGLGMLIGIVLLLVFLSSTTRFVAAIIGGGGFGAFIDELGKFVTSDNDYFFKPTAALVYVLFVLLFLAVRQVRTFRSLSPAESFVNAVEIAERLAVGEVSEADRDRALVLPGRGQRDRRRDHRARRRRSPTPPRPRLSPLRAGDPRRSARRATVRVPGVRLRRDGRGVRGPRRPCGPPVPRRAGAPHARPPGCLERVVKTLDDLRRIYREAKTIAVVGASAKPGRAAHEIPSYMRSQGYRVIPVSPRGGELFGEPVRASLGDIDGPIDIVDVF